MEVTDHSFGSTCQYEVGRCIGRGAFGTVRKASITEKGDFSGESELAEKEVILQPEPPLSRAAHVELLLRMKNTTMLKHDHLVPYHKVSVTKESERVMRCLFLMDFYADGDLAVYLKHLEQSSGKMDLSTAVCYAMQLADGVAHLHEKKFIHGDIKPSNILIKQRGNRHATLLKGDLDDVIQMQRSVTSTHDKAKFRGTMSYMSPEMLKKFVMGMNDERIGRKSDMWSLGCVVLELANFSCERYGKWLYNRSTNQAIQITTTSSANFFTLLKMILEGWVPFIDGSVPPKLSECIHECFRNVSDRTSAANFRAKIETSRNSIVPAGSDWMSADCYCVIPESAQAANEPFKKHANDDELWDTDGMCVTDAFLGLFFYPIITRDVKPHVCTDLGELSSAKLEEGLLRAAVSKVTGHGIPFGSSLQTISKSCAFFRKLVSLQYNNLLPFHPSHSLNDDDISQGSYLDRFLDKKRGTEVHPDISLLISFATQAAEGLRFLHTNGIFCGVLDPGSLYITKLGSAQYRFVIDLWKSHEHLATPEFFRKYRAPEVLKGTKDENDDEYYDGKNIGYKADMWSFGIIVILLANNIFGCITKLWLYNEITHERRKFPRSAKGILREFDEGFRPYIHRRVPKFLATCIRHCCCFDPIYRASADEILTELNRFGYQLQSTSNWDGLACQPADFELRSNIRFQTASATLNLSSLPTDNNGGIPRNVENEIIVLFPSVYSSDLEETFIFHPSTATLRPVSLLKRFPVSHILLSTWHVLNNDIIVHFKESKGQPRAISWDVLAETWFHLCYSALPDGYGAGFSTTIGNSAFFWCKGNMAVLQELNLLNGQIRALQPIPKYIRTKISKPLSFGGNLFSCAVGTRRKRNHNRFPDGQNAKLIPFGSKIICCAHSRTERWIICFDTSTKEWECFPDLPEPRKDYAALLVEEDLYILGGRTGHKSNETLLRSCLKFNVVTRSWKKVCDLTYPRFGHCAAACNEQIYVFGGRRRPWVNDRSSNVGHAFSDVDCDYPPIEALDGERNVWAGINMPGKDLAYLHGYSCATIKDSDPNEAELRKMVEY